MSKLKTPKADKITLEELKGSMCKWPIGDPKNENFHFCGDTRLSGESYCHDHKEIAYRTYSGGQAARSNVVAKKTAA